MAIVGKIGRYIGRKVAAAYVGKGKKLHQRIGRKVGGEIGRTMARSIPIIGSFKKGGKVHKTGAYLLHKGEKVIPTGRSCKCSSHRR